MTSLKLIFQHLSPVNRYKTRNIDFPLTTTINYSRFQLNVLIIQIYIHWLGRCQARSRREMFSSTSHLGVYMVNSFALCEDSGRWWFFERFHHIWKSNLVVVSPRSTVLMSSLGVSAVDKMSGGDHWGRNLLRGAQQSIAATRKN